MSKITLANESGTPTTPDTGNWRLYPKSDGWYAMNDAGVEIGPINTAAGLTITDTGGYYSSANVEGALAEIGARKKIIYYDETTLGSDGTFDFLGIPPSGALMEIVTDLRSDRATTSDGAKIKFNNDSGNTYVGQIQWGGPTPGWTQQTAAGGPIVYTYVTGNSSTANWFSHSKVIIPNYAGTHHYKTWQARGMQMVTSGGNTWIYDAAGQWQSTAAIYRVAIYPEVGTNFKTGSIARIRVFS